MSAAAVVAFLFKHWKLLAFLALVAAALAYGEVHGYGRGKDAGERAVRASEVAAANARADAAVETAMAAQAQAERYKTRAESQAAVAQQYQEALNDANRKHDRTVADLRAGTLKLQDRWRGCEVSRTGQAAPGGREPDADADLRAAGVADILRITAQCDAQVKGLQAIVTQERQ